MIRIRKSEERGHSRQDWLMSWHSFSFADYNDPEHVRFGCLRVINEDRVQNGAGFDTHGHRDMEILTYVLSGTLRHHDNMSNAADIHQGEIQLLRAGTGIMHSEFNPGPGQTHFLQIWILPDQQGLTPGYWKRAVSVHDKPGLWCVLVSRDGREDSLRIHQDVVVQAAVLDGEQSLRQPLQAGQRAYLHVARGTLRVNGHRLQAGDAIACEDEKLLLLEGASQAEVLLFLM